MDIKKAKQFSENRIRKEFRKYLEESKENNTVGRYTSDTFQLFKKMGSEQFWNLLESPSFESEAREMIGKYITKPRDINHSYTSLSAFKTFIETASFPEDEEEQALKAFLLDIDCIKPLTDWTKKLNYFDILKIAEVEIRHSNMLKWLLNPNETHGLGDDILKGFIRYYIESSGFKTDDIKFLLMDLYDFEIRREWEHTDIVAISKTDNFILCIENKIKSKEHDDQLDNYKKKIDKNYADYTQWFIYLTPDGEEASISDTWISMSYRDVLSILKRAFNKGTLSQESELLIKNYIDVIERSVVGDDGLFQECQKIYDNHPLAIDLLTTKKNTTFDKPIADICDQIKVRYQKELELIRLNRLDQGAQAAAIFKEWAQKKTEENRIVFNSESSVKRYTRFLTKEMSGLLPNSDELNGWGTHNCYFYEIYSLDGQAFRMQLELNSTGASDEAKSKCEELIKQFSTKTLKSNWQWFTVYRTDSKEIKKGNVSSQKDEIFKQLDGMLEKIKEFEENVIKHFQTTQQKD